MKSLANPLPRKSDETGRNCQKQLFKDSGNRPINSESLVWENLLDFSKDNGHI
jgi:hypothetical protein